MKILCGPDLKKAEALLDEVPFNTLFARMVVEGQMPGQVHADKQDGPSTFLIMHPYGMSLLLGSHDNEGTNAWLRNYMLNFDGQRKRPEWLQAHPQSWKPVIERILGPDLIGKATAPEGPAPPADGKGKVVELTRVNFRFSEARFRKYLESASPVPDAVVPTSAAMFDSIQGQVVPRYFWRDAGQFIRKGKGFSFIVNEKPVSTAFSAFVAPGILELGLETVDGHRGRGHAEHVSRALIEHCLESNLEPVWSCRLENAGSFNLARKLGFEPAVYIPYYRLAKG